MTNHYFTAALLCLLAFIGGCSDENKTERNNPEAINKTALIATVNYPLFYFSTTLAGDWADVSLPIPGNIDPALWQPGVNDILTLQKADLIILNGAGYSDWISKVSVSSSRLIDTSEHFIDQLIENPSDTTHSHGPKGEHSHGDYALTTWMDISLAKKQVNAIASALSDKWPDHALSVREKEKELLKQLTALDESYRSQSIKLAGKNIVYSHPVYQYFERRYQLPGYSLHWEPNQMPNQEQWELLETLSANKDSVLIWEDFPNQEIIEKIKQMELEFIVVRPMANKSSDLTLKTNWLEEQKRNYQRMNTL